MRLIITVILQDLDEAKVTGIRKEPVTSSHLLAVAVPSLAPQVRQCLPAAGCLRF